MGHDPRCPSVQCATCYPAPEPSRQETCRHSPRCHAFPDECCRPAPVSDTTTGETCGEHPEATTVYIDLIGGDPWMGGPVRIPVCSVCLRQLTPAGGHSPAESPCGVAETSEVPAVPLAGPAPAADVAGDAEQLARSLRIVRLSEPGQPVQYAGPELGAWLTVIADAIITSDWLAARDAAVARAASEKALLDAAGERAARRTAAGAADRFRDVLSECLGHPDENPGDDVLVTELRTHFGKTGSEPTRWRDFITGARAVVDQIQADRASDERGQS